MWRDWIPFWRPGASSYSGDIDLLFMALVTLSVAITILLFGLLLTFAIRYRKTSDADRSGHAGKSWRWEVAWTTATLVAFLSLFIWSASLYLQIYGNPDNALPIYVVAKQWMWKAQHPGGQAEINELHLPIDHTVRLILVSQDVIHSFFVPAFRVKHDVVPGRYQNLWFKPQKAGVFQLLCTEYCGTDHSRMTGRIVVMNPSDYEAWLSRQDATSTLASEGATIFRELGCSGCHSPQSTVRAPVLEGLYGRPVPLQDGTVTVANERYIRDSILTPRAQVTAGFAAVMPSYAGRVTEDELIRLVAYIKSLAGAGGPQHEQR
jgi:cytochrome c oxidase subunit 2